MQRPAFFTVFTILLLGLLAAAVLAIVVAAGWWIVAAVLLGVAIVWLAWGPDEWWQSARLRAAWTPAPAARPARVVQVAIHDEPADPGILATAYRPQCGALRGDGIQCRNSARGGSGYCSSHFGYQPRTAVGVVRRTDTVSKVARRDTVTSFAGDGTATTSAGAQCQALTAAGGGRVQCRNTVRAGSQFCGRHAGYRSPTPGAVVRGRDSKPRWGKAPDTLPRTRRGAAGYP